MTKCFLLQTLLVTIFSNSNVVSKNIQIPEDIYVIIYATKVGTSGHVGFAVDNYDILVKDMWKDGQSTVTYDTVANGTLTYYDLWGPTEMDFILSNLDIEYLLSNLEKDLACRYHKLPRTSAELDITIDRLSTKGLPHAYDYPSDAILRIPTTPSVGVQFEVMVDSIITARQYFNPRSYNCTDFAVVCLNEHLGIRISAKEFILFDWFSTPNQFYKSLVNQKNIEIIKAAPEELIENSFFWERILKSLIIKQEKNEKNDD